MLPPSEVGYRDVLVPEETVRRRAGEANSGEQGREVPARRCEAAHVKMLAATGCDIETVLFLRLERQAP